MPTGFDAVPSSGPGQPSRQSEIPGDERLGFPERVHAVVARIPSGRVTTYGAIARALGSPRSARMVGWALLYAPADRGLPCHRVVNRIGYLSGAAHFGHPDVMRNRLLAEAIPFRADYQVDLALAFWDPADDPDLDPLFHPLY